MNYEPLTEAEFLKLEAELKEITTFLPEGKMMYIWESFLKVRGGKRSPQPCSCKSSAGQWSRAIDTLRNFVNERKTEE